MVSVLVWLLSLTAAAEGKQIGDKGGHSAGDAEGAAEKRAVGKSLNDTKAQFTESGGHKPNKDTNGPVRKRKTPKTPPDQPNQK